MTATAPPLDRVVSFQAARGLSLAAALLGGWAVLHAVGVFWLDLSGWGLALAPVVVAAQCWLSVGLFIVAHDAMHGSLAPGRPRVNAAVGSVLLFLYVGFDFATLLRGHMAHHRAPGTAEDPDFHPPAPRALMGWYAAFIARYMGWRQIAFVLALLVGEHVLLGATVENQIVFWAVPAIASSFQLFFFGTWLPHRHGDDVFADMHRTRSNGYGSLLSLLTCFHFGYHHEHHLAPWAPWWRLPEVRRALRGVS